MRTIINGRCIVPNSDSSFCIKDNVAVIFDNKIKSIVPTDSIDVNHFDEVIDACGQYVSPGFINIHIHGCAGFDTMDENDNALYQMRHFLPSTGVTSFLPTTMTMPLNKIYDSLNRIRIAMNDISDDSALAKVLGANVEGPYISSKFKGAQAEDNIRRANFDEIAEFADVIKIITIAPEELGDTNFIKNCHKNNIIVSIGHSAADYDTAIETINNNDVKHITHLFNAQTGLHHRKPGIVGEALDTDAFVELIADNLHVHPAAQRLVYKVKKRSEIILITDSLRACGMGDGIYDLGGQKVYVKDNVATLEDG
ncbi:MAG: N-acetylglucosamine-6-phosphate deacetylase, partial [Selenomonadaceae bacterium]|nr:N-acetylglucosamine-6-phosphate deacetylase [Selenomonadaceae bacterium]